MPGTSGSHHLDTCQTEYAAEFRGGEMSGLEFFEGKRLKRSTRRFTRRAASQGRTFPSVAKPGTDKSSGAESG